ncbi:MAG: hypothetical protein IPM42_07875 [Saprospiraceae bacterium]|nr:hypothetical protein [Saprospiraceae bacterium]
MNDTKTEVPVVNWDTAVTQIIIQEAPTNSTDKNPEILSVTFDFTSKKGVFLDSIQLYRCDSNDDYESFFHFYHKGKRYTQEIYFAGIDDHFSIKHMNKNKYLDIVYKNISASGQGCLSQDIFVFDPVLKKYLRNGHLSTECYLSYNHKHNVYSGYSRGGGQTGPWHYYLFKLQKDTISIFESLTLERNVTCLDSLCNDVIINWKYTHFCKGDTIVYENLDKSKVNENIWMSQSYNPNTRCQFIKRNK